MKTVSSPLGRSTSPAWPRLLLAAAAGYVLLRAALEFYAAAPVSGEILGKLSVKWSAAYLTFLGGLVLILALVAAALFRPGFGSRRLAALITARQRRPQIFRLAALLVAELPPVLLVFTPLGELLRGDYLRLLVLLFGALIVAAAFSDDSDVFIQPVPFLFGLALAGSLFILAERLSNVTSYPFSLTWSEGNRLYDFSMRVDPGRYELAAGAQAGGGRSAGAVGRNFLWGLPFLIPGSTIWLHRLWDAGLWTWPYLLLGYVLARRSGMSGLSRWIFTLWVFVFLFQGPIYSPLVLSALVVVLLVRPGSPMVTVVAVVGALAAGYYAAASRWTWLPAAAAWSGILLLAAWQPPQASRWKEWIAPLARIALVVAAGLAGGLLANPRLLSPNELKTSTALSQPLLWNRLLPNVNYPEGIFFGLVIATLPVVILLAWLGITRRWHLSWLHALAYAIVCLVFLGGGLVASVKIGGGNNLHNLDMFLITLAILAAIAWAETGPAALAREIQLWPKWAAALLGLSVLLPAWNAVQLGRPPDLPAKTVVQDALQVIQTRVGKAQKRGEVLFIDQRQLLTFGAVNGIRLIPEYEKKFLMDKAMAGDADYFSGFYRDLAAGRFAMIVTEPLYINEQDPSFGFQEENNAWVEWVSKPLLCFYAPVETLPEVRTQILVPRSAPEGCESYLKRFK